MARDKKLRGRDTKPAGSLFCSFCGKDAKSVKTLIQGPSAFICNECVSVCQKVLRRQMFPGFPSLEKYQMNNCSALFSARRKPCATS